KDKDEYVCNEADQMTEIKMGIPGWSGNMKFAYERDADGQITHAIWDEGVEGTETTESKYDENNRLIESSQTISGETTKHPYEYDKAGDPTKIYGEGSYTYNAADQLKEGPPAKYTYNEDGDRTKLEPKNGEPATTYGYDQTGHL